MENLMNRLQKQLMKETEYEKDAEECIAI